MKKFLLNILILCCVVVTGFLFMRYQYQQQLQEPPLSNQFVMRDIFLFSKGLRNLIIIVVPVLLIFMVRGWWKKVLIVVYVAAIVLSYYKGLFEPLCWYSVSRDGRVQTFPGYDGTVDMGMSTIDTKLW